MSDKAHTITLSCAVAAGALFFGWMIWQMSRFEPMPPQWIERFLPTTDEERKAVAEMEARTIGAQMRSLAGHDQDWDDVIKAAHKAALEACCRPTYWEQVNTSKYHWEFTGRWRPAVAPKS